jgi:hypothetical protein
MADRSWAPGHPRQTCKCPPSLEDAHRATHRRGLCRAHGSLVESYVLMPSRGHTEGSNPAEGTNCWSSGLGLYWLLYSLVGLVVWFLLLWILWSYPCLCARSSNSLAVASDTDITDVAGRPTIAYMAAPTSQQYFRASCTHHGDGHGGRATFEQLCCY